MKAETTISFLRHGRVHNPNEIFYGRLPRFGLSARGREEAQAAALALAQQPVAEVFSSPLLRARQTAEPVLKDRDGLRLRVSRLLLEVKTPYQGHPAAEVQARSDDVYTGAGPEFEQPEDVLARVLRFVDRVLHDFPGAHVVAVTHGDPVAFLTLWAGGLEITPQNKTQLAPLGIVGGYPATGSITTFVFRDRRPVAAKPALRYWRPSI